MSKMKNIVFSNLDDLDWSQDNRNESFKKIHKYITDEAGNAINWYLDKKRGKRIGARCMRICAIISTTIAGIIPLLSQIYNKNNMFAVDPAWASIALIFSAAFIVLDKFFGFSSSWIRFIMAESELKKTLQEYIFDWQMKMSELKGNVPDDAQLKDLLNISKEYLEKINDIINNEIKQWKSEFQSIIKQMEEKTKKEEKINKLFTKNLFHSYTYR